MTYRNLYSRSKVLPSNEAPLIKEKCNINEKLDEVTTTPRSSRATGVWPYPRPQRVEQRKLSSRNFYVVEKKKCKSEPLGLRA